MVVAAASVGAAAVQGADGNLYLRLLSCKPKSTLKTVNRKMRKPAWLGGLVVGRAWVTGICSWVRQGKRSQVWVVGSGNY